jgi:hypothetical protein
VILSILSNYCSTASTDVSITRNQQVLSQHKNELYNISVLPVELPANEDGARILDPGQTSLIPLWIRGDRIGKHLHKFLFTYQSVVSCVREESLARRKPCY